ncbi:MAG: dihydrolipoyllysine-residue acetyltransferase [Pseudomonadota bacterium]|nr:dihydrolipoyllysine-residue acetyltransferase [Pseudomonadota bacterium]
MAEIKAVRIPDLGGASNVDVIEVLVKLGDVVELEQGLLTLEGEKATMEIPTPFAGKVVEVKVRVGDKINENDVVVMIEVADEAIATSAAAEPAAKPASTEPVARDVFIPDIGGVTSVDVIAVSMKVGDEVAEEDTLMTLEGEKATMDIPAPFAGKITEVLVAIGNKVSAGDKIATMLAKPSAIAAPITQSAAVPAASATPTPIDTILPVTPFGANVHASPSVRRIAREFGVDLRQVRGSGRKGRIVKQDVQAYVRGELAKPRGGAGIAIAPAPKIDFAKFGEIELQPLNKIKKLTGANVHRSWVTIPHVTQFGNADITELEALRNQQKADAAARGVKLTPLVYIMKAVVASLQAFPLFNSSLDESGENLVLKKYFHLGIAADTPNGLVVPVVRDVDKKDIFTLAEELAQLSAKARDKGLSSAEMAGSCFTISSLGGIGGTAFTPIVKSPDVAILGVSRSSMQPVYQDGEFVARLLLPLSLSYDHRVIDGADGARFIVDLADRLAKINDNLE